jgi:hypothetical protein
VDARLELGRAARRSRSARRRSERERLRASRRAAPASQSRDHGSRRAPAAPRATPPGLRRRPSSARARARAPGAGEAPATALPIDRRTSPYLVRLPVVAAPRFDPIDPTTGR